MSLARICTLTGAAALLKLTLGSDDLVWLAPFVARETSRMGKLWVVVLYTASVGFLVAVATAVGIATNTAANSSATESAQMWIKGIAGTLLVVYSLWMACQHNSGGADSECEEEEEAPLFDAEATPSKSPKRNSDSVVVVALLGSLDDFTVYLIMGGSGVYTWYELILGTLVGCIVLASLVALLTESAAIASILERIPAWMILMALGVWVLSDLLPGH
eukprot:Hpha_TRINITY_DN26274_c0_g1::TRINITY_DN26274_c0_g1_i2::g.184825::m.184825